MRRSVFLGCASVVALAWYAPAAAQEPAQTESASDTAPERSIGLDEITVTATRRETDLQDTPIAVSAVDSRTIERASAVDLGDLAKFVPNFNAAKLTGFNAASFALRGIGVNNIIVYVEPPVAVLVDDFVYSSIQTQLLDTFDIEQVEVLRGPQGTLFGRNTTGGAVSVKTKRPVLGEFSGQLRGALGSFKTREVQGALNIPLGDTLALRLVGSYDFMDGYMRNGACYGPITPLVSGSPWEGVQGCGDGERVGGTDVFYGRAKLLWEPTDDFSALLQYEMLRDRSESPAAVNETPASNTFLFNLLGLGANTGDPIQLAGVSNRDAEGILVSKGHMIDVDGVFLNMDKDFDFGKLTSVTGYRYQMSQLASTYPGVAPVAPNGDVLSLFDASRDDERTTWQQELRFASDFSGPFNFVGGGFFQKEKIAFCVPEFLGFLDLSSGPLPFGNWNDQIYTLCNSQKSRSIALFAEGTFDITSRLTLTVGGRYTWDDKTWQGRQQVFYQQLNGGFDPALTFDALGDNLAPADFERFPFGVVTVQQDWAEPSYRASLGYQATDDIYLYAQISHGYKAGGFNDQIGTFHPFVNGDGSDNLEAFAEAARPTNPEFADSYEAGFKSEWYDSRLRLNVTGFYVEYSDLQKQIVRPIVVNGAPFQVSTYFNAAKADVKGVEAEIAAVPVEGLTLRGVLGFQDGRYIEYVVPLPAGYDLTTSPLDRTPKWQWTVDATYERPILSDYKVTLNGNVNYTSESLFSQSLTSPAENTFLNERTLANISITFSDIDDRYFIRGVGRNIGDARYRTASLTVGGLWTFTLYGPPEYYGLEAGVSF